MAKTIKKTGTNPAATNVAPAPAKKKTTAKKAAAKKSASKKTVARKTAAKKTTPKRATAGPTPSGRPQGARSGQAVTQPRQISAAERRHMIAEAAYLRSESRGFISDEREDWLVAEAEVDLRLSRMKLTVRD